MVSERNTHPVPGLAQARSGIGLRSPHALEILRERPSVGFLEAHSENFFKKGVLFETLLKLRDHYPISLHGVGLSLGSADGVKHAHLEKLKSLVDEIRPALVSEHVSWSGLGATAVPDLLPLPMTNEALDVLCDNIDRVQTALKRTILIENPSSYLAFRGAEMSEPEFLSEARKRAGCGLLLDVNNIHVSAHNLGLDAHAFIDALPRGGVDEIHLAGYQINPVEGGEIFIDAHNHPVHDDVWALYAHALKKFGNIPTLIEWDNDLPELSILLAEAEKADHIRSSLSSEAPHVRAG